MSPLFLVPKSGKFRLVDNYQTLRQYIVSNSYPTPSVQSLMHRVSCAKIFGKLDLAKAYHQNP